MTQKKRDGSVLLYCLITAAICLAICSKSSFLYPINDWTDANAYFSCGKGMLNGRVMYRDLYEHKGPLLYALHLLCCMLDYHSFFGVFLLEILSVGLFLFAGYRTLELYGARRAALLGLPLVAALVLSSVSFQQGDSAEELCLPLLSGSLFFLLRWLRNTAPDRMSAKLLILNGFMGGCVLWVKFTLLGFYAPWLLGLMIYHFIHKKPKAAWTVLGWFVAGAALATVPWLLYFGINGAIGPWLKTYLYDNLFLYQDTVTGGLIGRMKAALHSVWDWATMNWAYTVPTLLGSIWFTLRRADKQSAPSAAEKWMIWFMGAFLTLSVFIGGKSYLYYGLILAAFAPLMLLPLRGLAERLPWGRKAFVAITAAIMLTGSLGLCLAASPNTPELLKPREDTMQYRFAAIVNQTPNATLLNYGFMDAGFYTACGIAPTVKYFHRTNVHLPEMLEEQDRYVVEGVTDYVVTRSPLSPAIASRYVLVSTEKSTAGFWYDTVYLYRRNNPAVS